MSKKENNEQPIIIDEETTEKTGALGVDGKVLRKALVVGVIRGAAAGIGSMLIMGAIGAITSALSGGDKDNDEAESSEDSENPFGDFTEDDSDVTEEDEGTED